MTLAIDGGAPVRTKPWPEWPPPLDTAQRDLLWKIAESGRWGATQGDYCRELGERFAAAAGTEHGVTVANGTLALFVALRAVGVEPGDEVIVPSYTFVACATSVLLAGAVPVVVDVDEENLHIDPAAVEAAIGPRTAAIMPVHLAGCPADMTSLCEVARRHRLALVEDCAQALGATYYDRPVGGLGDAGAFSFQSSKAMTAGEGGIVVVPDAEAHARAWSVANLGRRPGGQWYEHPDVGWNLRLTELQAGILLPWLDRLTDEVERREAFGARLGLLLADAECGVRPVPQPEGTTRDSRHLYMMRLPLALDGADRDRFFAAMAAEGVPVDAGYPPLGSLASVAATAADGRAVVHDAPNAAKAATDVIWLRQPMLMDDPSGADDVVAALDRVLLPTTPSSP